MEIYYTEHVAFSHPFALLTMLHNHFTLGSASSGLYEQFLLLSLNYILGFYSICNICNWCLSLCVIQEIRR